MGGLDSPLGKAFLPRYQALREIVAMIPGEVYSSSGGPSSLKVCSVFSSFLPPAVRFMLVLMISHSVCVRECSMAHIP